MATAPSRPTVNLPYLDAAVRQMEAGEKPPSYWRNYHWGLFADPGLDDDSPARYFEAAEAMVDYLLVAAGVTDGRRIIDVGCGFGGALDQLKRRHRDCQLFGLNIDGRQLRWAHRLLSEPDRATGGPVALIQGDGCQLPLADRSFDHVLAVECVFHFPSRKGFFREAARALRPGGTLALSDFVIAPGMLSKVAATAFSVGLGDWYGHSSTPITSVTYERIGRMAGFELLVDDDVTDRTLPTYPALRRIYRESGATDGIASIDGLERVAAAGGLEYHVLSFRRR